MIATVRRRVVEDHAQLRVADLPRRLRLRPGPVPSAIRVEIATGYGRAERMVTLDATAQPFGGWRRYFRCPRCDARRLVLLIGSEGEELGCRGCLQGGLPYASQTTRVRVVMT